LTEENEKLKNRQPTISFSNIVAPFTNEESLKTKRLAAMVACGDLRPLSFAEKSSWMSKLLSHVSSERVQSFSHSTLMSTAVDLEIEVKHKFCEQMLECDSFSFTTDAWSSGSKSFVAFTNHFVDTSMPIWSLEHACMNVCNFPGSHTGEALGKCIEDTIDGILQGKPIDNDDTNNLRLRVWAGVADGAAAQQKAFTYLGSGFHIWQFWCICHVIHLSVKDALSSEGDLAKAICRLRKLVVTIRNSNLLTEQLGTINKQLENGARRLALDVVTRWTSTHTFLGHVVENREGIDKIAENKIFEAQEKVSAKRQRNAMIEAGYNEKQIDGILNDYSGKMSVDNEDWEIAALLEGVLRPVKTISPLLHIY